MRQVRYLGAAAFLAIALVANTAFAAGKVEDVICDVYYLVSDLGGGIATIGVLALGIAAMFGKISWGMAITFAVGIAIMMGAVAVVDMFGITSPCT